MNHRYIVSGNPNPLASAEFAGAKKNTTLADPYNPESTYSNTEANAIKQPKSDLHAGTTGVKEKAEEKAEVVKDKVTPNKSSTTDSAESGSSSGTTPSKKAGFMEKLKGQSKILSGKLSKNDDKIAEGQALKTGQAHP